MLPTLVGPARAHADVADISCFDDIVKSLHSLLDGRVVVEAVAYSRTLSCSLLERRTGDSHWSTSMWSSCRRSRLAFTESKMCCVRDEHVPCHRGMRGSGVPYG